MYRLVGFTSDTLGDLPAARDAMTTLLNKGDSSVILSTDFEELANINSKIPGSEQEAFKYYRMAIAKDTIMDDRVKLINRAADLAKKMGDKKAQADWLGIAYHMKKDPSITDIYNYGFAEYQAGAYDTSYHIFDTLRMKYPNEIYGYLWTARSMRAKDSTLVLAVPEYEKLAENGKRIDSMKYKIQVIEAYSILASYSNNEKKDKPAAIGYLQKILDLDPGNADAQKFIEILKRPPPKQPAAKPKTTTKSNGK
jgi:tetratricopeptide (TPR) repeat protein